MSILIYADLAEGIVKKATLEAIQYGAHLSQKLQQPAHVLVVGTADNQTLQLMSQYGVQNILHANDAKFNDLDASVASKIILEEAAKLQAHTLVFAHNFAGKAIAPQVAAKWKAGYVAGAISYPEMIDGGWVLRKQVFSGKAFAQVKIQSENRVISILPNSFPLQEVAGSPNVMAITPQVSDADFKVKVIRKETISGEVPLTEAEIVVSGGRGLKGPENWGILLDLAKSLDAATACSRPVSDDNWRPHHEHVGQTGFTIRPNLYIAVGISGAIQHLAGVNGSKTIVVINKDPEAPFFKAADYGIIGDAFEILPKLTAAVQAYKKNS
jgi:electron transfer flavoprotein alpha subunit